MQALPGAPTEQRAAPFPQNLQDVKPKPRPARRRRAPDLCRQHGGLKLRDGLALAHPAQVPALSLGRASRVRRRRRRKVIVPCGAWATDAW